MAKTQTNGGVLSFTTSSWAPDIVTYSKDGESSDDVETSNLGTTGYRTYEGGELVEGGTYTFECQVDPLTARLGNSITDTVTWTYPISVAGNTAATEVFQGYINNYSESGEINGLILCSVTIKVAGTPVFTAETV